MSTCERCEALEAAIEDNLPAFNIDNLTEAKWNEWTGELTLNENDWGAIRESYRELKKALKS